MLTITTAILILLPFVLAGLCLLSGKDRALNLWVYLCSVALIPASMVFAARGNGFVLSTFDVPFNLGLCLAIVDFLVLIVIASVGLKHKHPPIICFSFMQIGLLFYLDNILNPLDLSPFIHADTLSIVMLMIVSVIGSLICLFAIPYMKKHEKHVLLVTRPKRFFFAVMLLFLGSMNGLVLTNNILFLYTFFEITSLCSFWLIGFDRTFAATKNALKALWMNSLGGLALLIAVTLFYTHLETLDMREIITMSFGNASLMLPLCMLILAAFIKSAQPPFQSWLLGAMVAPTPVSALLHSSTMVKVGVYMAIRFAPAYMDSFLSVSVALLGAFVFLSAALSAIGQSNGKKILAYSTISNLGLIFACAGIGTSEAITAGIFLIIFHAVSKALLFLCTGTVEQKIGSRDIEDMRGVYRLMPFTAMMMLIGIMTMILPPFGMLMGKWIALEAVAAINLPVILLLAIGSSATLLYWARWAGLLLSGSAEDVIKPTSTAGLPLLTKAPLALLCAGALILSFFAPLLFETAIAPATEMFGLTPFAVTGLGLGLGLAGYQGAFWIAPLFVVVIVAVWLAARLANPNPSAARDKKPVKHLKPFMCGIETDKQGTFLGPMNKPALASVFNYYFMGFCTEETSVKVFNTIALIVLVFMLGVSIENSYSLGEIW